MLSSAQIEQFKIDGYVVLKRELSESFCNSLRADVTRLLQERVEPYELEADVHYPGAPESPEAEGGQTIRRLKRAYERGDHFVHLAEHPQVIEAAQNILATDTILLNPNHHNCIMTKQPAFSSATLWHRDTRYWHFSDKYLINSWIALGEEKRANGAMHILPGSHRWSVNEEALDDAQFLRLDHPDNQDRLATARTVELEQGDILLFSAHCFHAAGKNTTEQPKYSVVFTYHGESTTPIEGTVSSGTPEISIT